MAQMPPTQKQAVIFNKSASGEPEWMSTMQNTLKIHVAKHTCLKHLEVLMSPLFTALI